MRILLIGNYGVGNFGDEVLKEYFVSALNRHTVRVVSHKPAEGEFARLPAGVRSFLSFRWLKTLKELRRTDVVIFGGGTLFTDTESIKACFLWALHALAARVFRKPYFLAFQGFGPFHTRLGKRISSWVVRHAAYVSVRDEASADRLKLANMNKEFVQTFDPAFLLFRREKIETDIKNVFMIIPRDNSGNDFVESAVKSYSDSKFDELCIALFRPDHENEQIICSKLKSRLPKARIREIRTWSDLQDCAAGAGFVFSARLHGSLYALATGTDFRAYSQSAADKHSQVHADLDPVECERLASEGEQTLLVRLSELWPGVKSDCSV